MYEATLLFLSEGHEATILFFPKLEREELLPPAREHFFFLPPVPARFFFRIRTGQNGRKARCAGLGSFACYMFCRGTPRLRRPPPR